MKKWHTIHYMHCHGFKSLYSYEKFLVVAIFAVNFATLIASVMLAQACFEMIKIVGISFPF